MKMKMKNAFNIFKDKFERLNKLNICYVKVEIVESLLLFFYLLTTTIMTTTTKIKKNKS